MKTFHNLILAAPIMAASALFLFGCSAGEPATHSPQSEAAFAVNIVVDASKPIEPLRDFWRFFGADEPNYAYGPHGEKLISELGALKPGAVYFRAHNLLTTGDGSWGLKWGSTNAYTEDENGAPVYDWTIVDRNFRYLPQTRRTPICGNRLHARGAVRQP